MTRERKARLDLALLLASALLGASLLAAGVYRIVALATRQLDVLEQRIEGSHACGPNHENCPWEDN